MFDVLIIGAGVIGANLLRELSRYQVRAAVLEKENDVGLGATRANSAIVHAGYDPEPGTKMARFNVQGSNMMEQLCQDLSVPYRRNGSMVIAFEPEEEEALRRLYRQGKENGVQGLQLLTKQQALEREPNLNPHLYAALYAPTGAIISPWELTVALCDNAMENGAQCITGQTVCSIIKKPEGHFMVKTQKGEVYEARFVVNAAGVYADQISAMAGSGGFSIHPSKGSYYVLDKSQCSLVHSTIFQCPSKAGKGVLISPTVHGNLIVGPDAQEIQDREDTSCQQDRLSFVRRTAEKTSAKVDYRESIRNFAGIRANCDRPDFIIEQSSKVPGFFEASGIKSPGLSASPAIALELVRLLEGAGLPLPLKPDFQPRRSKIHFKVLSEQEKQRLIQDNPAFGRVICRCETVTEGEILQALASPTCPPTLDGVKRRCNAGLGRCQGGFCGPRVCELIAKTRGVSMLQVQKDREGSYILTREL